LVAYNLQAAGHALDGGGLLGTRPWLVLIPESPHIADEMAAWRSHTPVGVSLWTWTLTVLEGLKRGFYGVLVEAVPIMVYGSTATLLGLLVLLRPWVARDRIQTALIQTER
jgi:hypothetical protein